MGYFVNWLLYIPQKAGFSVFWKVLNVLHENLKRDMLRWFSSIAKNYDKWQFYARQLNHLECVSLTDASF